MATSDTIGNTGGFNTQLALDQAKQLNGKAIELFRGEFVNSSEADAHIVEHTISVWEGVMGSVVNETTAIVECFNESTLVAFEAHLAPFLINERFGIALDGHSTTPPSATINKEVILQLLEDLVPNLPIRRGTKQAIQLVINLVRALQRRSKQQKG